MLRKIHMNRTDDLSEASRHRAKAIQKCSAVALNCEGSPA